METKSRYEIIAELETRKAELLGKQATVGLNEANLKREIERAQEDLAEFAAGKDIAEKNLKDQLESIEKSLDRLNRQKK